MFRIMYIFTSMKATKYILHYLVIGTALSVFPYWAATVFDLHVFAFIATFDFVLLMIIVSARDFAKGRTSNDKSKIKFPFPFYDSDY